MLPRVCSTSTSAGLSMEISKGYAYRLIACSASSQHFQSNILIVDGTPPRACLADFGLSTFIPSTQEGQSTSTTSGTTFFMAPELLAPKTFGLAKSPPTQPADIYAMGMVIYEVLTGFYPFYDLKLAPLEVALRVQAGKRPTKPGNAEGIGFGSGTWELVQECWKAKSVRRPTVDRVVRHLEHVSTTSAPVPPTGAQHPGIFHISTHSISSVTFPFRPKSSSTAVAIPRLSGSKFHRSSAADHTRRWRGE